jgi:para-aminobenzoate synthetase component 1
LLKNKLFNDEKEKTENIMIVDLVRNDLAKISKKNTVKVEELCNIYTFETVHQMISTITSEIEKDMPIESIFKATFPMGSMTGAPKLNAMRFSELYETSKRGLYSGTVGYITPQGNFDFNVVIRSILYNQKKGYLSLQVGSAITFNSNPESEYAECLLKAKGLLKALEVNFE